MNKRYLSGVGLVVLVSTLVLSSCGIRSTYKEPELPKENLYRDAATTDTTTIGNIPWKTYFADPNLQALIDEALVNNYDLKIAVTRIEQAEANLGIARAAFFPDLNLNGNSTTNRTSSTEDILNRKNNSSTIGITSTWEADIWGKLYKQKRGALAQFLQTEAYRNLIQTSLIANLATSYYSLLALDEQLKITKEVTAILQESVNTMELLKDAAILNGAAVEQNKSLLYATEINIPGLENQIWAMENSINLMLGRQPAPIARSTMSNQVVPVDVSVGIPAQMLARRPDVKQAEYGFRAAFEAVGVAQARFYPAITLSGTIGYSSGAALENFFKPEHIIANVIGNLAQPIFARRQLTAGLKIAKAQQEEALYQFRQTVLTAGKEVSDALFAYDAAMRKDAIREKQVKADETSVFFTQELLKSGDANYLEVLTAEQNLLQSRLGQVNDKLQQLQATVTLYRALGGGVE